MSLRTSPQTGMVTEGNAFGAIPPVLQSAYRYAFPLNRGIPTPVWATSRNDSVISAFQLLIRIRGEGFAQHPDKFQLIEQLRKGISTNRNILVIPRRTDCGILTGRQRFRPGGSSHRECVFGTSAAVKDRLAWVALAITAPKALPKGAPQDAPGNGHFRMRSGAAESLKRRYGTWQTESWLLRMTRQSRRP